MMSCTCSSNPTGTPSPGAHFHWCPSLGPTYTDLAHEIDRLKTDNAALLHAWHEAYDHNNFRPGEDIAGTMHPGSALLDELENLRKQVEALKAGQRNASEARQRAFLELAEDLAAMTPEKRDAAIKRIIDNAGENRP